MARSNNSSVSGGSTSNESITLWQFLLELLRSKSYSKLIRWTGNSKEFKLVDAEGVAQLWGQRKNKPNMNYDKLSRAIRYYYEKNIIKKVSGQKFVYCFQDEKSLTEEEISGTGQSSPTPPAINGNGLSQMQRMSGNEYFASLGRATSSLSPFVATSSNSPPDLSSEARTAGEQQRNANGWRASTEEQRTGIRWKASPDRQRISSGWKTSVEQQIGSKCGQSEETASAANNDTHSSCGLPTSPRSTKQQAQLPSIIGPASNQRKRRVQAETNSEEEGITFSENITVPQSGRPIENSTRSATLPSLKRVKPKPLDLSEASLTNTVPTEASSSNHLLVPSPFFAHSNPNQVYANSPYINQLYALSTGLISPFPILGTSPLLGTISGSPGGVKLTPGAAPLQPSIFEFPPNPAQMATLASTLSPVMSIFGVFNYNGSCPTYGISLMNRSPESLKTPVVPFQRDV